MLLGVVLFSRFISWPQEFECALTSVVAVRATYGVAVVVVRLPGVSRIG